MYIALLYGFLSGFALFIGSLVGLYLKIPKKWIALIMAFGCGVLISSLSIDLMTEAFELSKKIYLISIVSIISVVKKENRHHTHQVQMQKNLHLAMQYSSELCSMESQNR